MRLMHRVALLDRSARRQLSYQSEKARLRHDEAIYHDTLALARDGNRAVAVQHDHAIGEKGQTYVVAAHLDGGKSGGERIAYRDRFRERRASRGTPRPHRPLQSAVPRAVPGLSQSQAERSLNESVQRGEGRAA